MTQETEIKIPLAALNLTLEQAQARIEALGFIIEKPRVFERNLVFDNSGELRESRRLLRLRQAGETATLTYKGVPSDGGAHKSREERETQVASFDEMRVILERLGYAVSFVYEKYRTEFRDASHAGTITLDETPAGNFLEIEGEPEWIDATAKRLGATPADYSTASYARIYLDWCASHGIAATHMRFT